MSRLLIIAMLATTTSCASFANMFDRGPKADPNVESQYRRALALLEPGAATARLDSAVVFLDGYLAHAGYIERRPEAQVLKRLVSDAIQLARVATALQQERAASNENRAKTADGGAARSDSDSVREIERLKNELAAANAELERIRKRLATQKP